MKRTIIIGFAAVFCSNISYSKTIIVDVYGAGKIQAQAILKKYTQHITEVELESDKEIIHEIISGQEDIRAVEKIRSKEAILTNKITKEGGFLYVDFHTTSYPNHKNLYTTIEVIEKNRPDRLRFVSPKIDVHQIYEASTSAVQRKVILNKGKDNLVRLLSLKQPNNHDFAYLILKRISGKKYGENNIDAWEKWLSTAQNKYI